jgi:hypothetical protein
MDSELDAMPLKAPRQRARLPVDAEQRFVVIFWVVGILNHTSPVQGAVFLCKQKFNLIYK